MMDEYDDVLEGSEAEETEPIAPIDHVDDEPEEPAAAPMVDPRLREMERIMDAVGWEDPSHVSKFVGEQLKQVREQERQAELTRQQAERQREFLKDLLQKKKIGQLENKSIEELEAELKALG